MNPLSMLEQHQAWLDREGPLAEVVISSRVRLARNVVNRPFPERSDKTLQRLALEEILEATRRCATLAGSQRIDLGGVRKLERQFLVERHLISPEMAFGNGERAVVIGEQQSVTLMINEEDHLRLQSFEAGLDLEKAHRRADRIDNELGEQLPFAFDPEWGYCTACPTNVGTGMRASCLVHLPALVMNQEIGRVLHGLSRLGVVARGLYGEGTQATGDLFQISNATTLGHKEDELVENISRVVKGVAGYEREARARLVDLRNRMVTEDSVFRAWGLLREARRIAYEETMLFLSRVRLGLHLGFPIPVTMAKLNELMILAQPAHLQIAHGEPMKAEQRDVIRAAMLRKKLAEGPRTDRRSGHV